MPLTRLRTDLSCEATAAFRVPVTQWTRGVRRTYDYFCQDRKVSYKKRLTLFSLPYEEKLPSFPNFQPTTLTQPWTQQPKTTDPACWPAVIGSLIKSRSSTFTLSTNSLRISTINPKGRAVPLTTCCWTWRKWKPLFRSRAPGWSARTPWGNIFWRIAGTTGSTRNSSPFLRAQVPLTPTS